MFAVQDEKILAYVPDYFINIIEPYAMSDEEVNCFQTGLRELILFIKYSMDEEKLRQIVSSDQRFKTLNFETAQLIKTMTHSSELELTPTEEGKVDMCKALMDMKQKSKAEGMREGMVQKQLATIELLMKKQKMSLWDVMELLEIPVDEQAKYAELIEGKK